MLVNQKCILITFFVLISNLVKPNEQRLNTSFQMFAPALQLTCTLYTSLLIFDPVTGFYMDNPKGPAPQ